MIKNFCEDVTKTTGDEPLFFGDERGWQPHFKL